MDEIQKLIQHNLRKRLFVGLHFPIAEEREMLRHIPDHLRYMEEHEDRVLMSGPFIAEGKVVDAGMTVLRVDNEAEARAFMDAEPLIRRGLRRYELRIWEVREGTLTIQARLSASKLALS
jgi:uncharacterized protein YciI